MDAGLIAQFVSVAGCDPPTAEAYLSASGGDLEAAVNTFLAGAPLPAAQVRAAPYHPRGMLSREEAPHAHRGAARAGARLDWPRHSRPTGPRSCGTRPACLSVQAAGVQVRLTRCSARTVPASYHLGTAVSAVSTLCARRILTTRTARNTTRGEPRLAPPSWTRKSRKQTFSSGCRQWVCAPPS